MINCTHIAPPGRPTGGDVAPLLFTSHMIEPFHTPEYGRGKTMLDGRENAGGSVARHKSRLPHRHGAAHTLSVPFTSTGARPRDAGHISVTRVCPQCGSPVDRVRRRIIDRLVSCVSPVHRYRCRMKGWGCDWEGNLRV